MCKEGHQKIEPEIRWRKAAEDRDK